MVEVPEVIFLLGYTLCIQDLSRGTTTWQPCWAQRVSQKGHPFPHIFHFAKSFNSEVIKSYNQLLLYISRRKLNCPFRDNTDFLMPPRMPLLSALLLPFLCVSSRVFFLEYQHTNKYFHACPHAYFTSMEGWLIDVRSWSTCEILKQESIKVAL